MKFFLYQLATYNPMQRRALLRGLEEASNTGDPEEIALAERVFMLGGRYERIAEVEARSIDHAYQLTNTIEAPWYESPEVKILGAEPGYRSTDVGDILVCDSKAYCCAPFGWHELSPAIERWLTQHDKPEIRSAATRESLVFDGGQGFDFKALIVRQGEVCRSNQSIIHPEPDPLVEFYDARFPHCEHGQFVSSYYAMTLLSGMPDAPTEHNTPGLNLNGGVDAWQFDGARRALVTQWLRTSLGITPQRIAAAESALAAYDFGGELLPDFLSESWSATLEDRLSCRFMVAKPGETFDAYRGRPVLTVEVAFAPGSAEVTSVSAKMKGEPVTLLERGQSPVVFDLDDFSMDGPRQ